MKAKLTVANAKSSEIKELMAIAASAGSDNGLSPNYFSVPTPIIEPKTIRGGAKPYAAFVTLLFNPENLEFVKIGSVSVRGVQRTANVCENDPLPLAVSLLWFDLVNGQTFCIAPLGKQRQFLFLSNQICK